MKWSVTLTDRLGPEILTVLEIKGQVLHRVRLHMKVPGWSLNLNALLTKKLPKFLSRLNEMSGGRENVFSFGIIAAGRILKFFRMTFLIARFLGAVFACGYSGVRVAAFFEKLAHFLAFVVKVGVVTAEASQSEEVTDRLFQIFCSRSLRQYHINYKFHVSVRLLTIKISQ